METLIKGLAKLGLNGFESYGQFHVANFEFVDGFSKSMYNLGKLPKAANLEYVLNKMASKEDSVYVNLAKTFKKLIPQNLRADVYGTTYGIGVTMQQNIAGKFEIDEIADFLKENQIEYSTQWSDANWVYRYVISKSKNNLERIKALR